MQIVDENQTHELKTDPALFDAVARGDKTYEIRLNDRNFKVGDTLFLRETTIDGATMKALGKPPEYTGRTETRVISHIQTGYGLAENWCILSFRTPDRVDPENQVLDLQVAENIGFLITDLYNFEGGRHFAQRLEKAIHAAGLSAFAASSPVLADLPIIDRRKLLNNGIDFFVRDKNATITAYQRVLAHKDREIEDLKLANSTSISRGANVPATPYFVVDHPGGVWTIQSLKTRECVALQYGKSSRDIAEFIVASCNAAASGIETKASNGEDATDINAALAGMFRKIGGTGPCPIQFAGPNAQLAQKNVAIDKSKEIKVEMSNQELGDALLDTNLLTPRQFSRFLGGGTVVMYPDQILSLANMVALASARATALDNLPLYHDREFYKVSDVHSIFSSKSK